MSTPPEGNWRSKLLQPLLRWRGRNIRPAEISNGLVSVMLARENLLEDVNYTKIVPNRYLVEVSEENYARNFRPIESRIVEQWRQKMLEHLMTANSRQGRREYRFGGGVQIAIRSSPDLEPGQGRLYFRIEADGGPSVPPPPVQASLPAAPSGMPSARPAPPLQAPGQASRPASPPPPQGQPVETRQPPEALEQTRASVGKACLELWPQGRRWQLHPGIVTIGRNVASDIHLNMPEVQEKRLVSGEHAYVLNDSGEYRIFDGTPGGRSSVNGTYVNSRRVPPEGVVLHHGDLVTLAALDPNHPRPEDLGVVSFRFWMDCDAWT